MGVFGGGEFDAAFVSGGEVVDAAGIEEAGEEEGACDFGSEDRASSVPLVAEADRFDANKFLAS